MVHAKVTKNPSTNPLSMLCTSQGYLTRLPTPSFLYVIHSPWVSRSFSWLPSSLSDGFFWVSSQGSLLLAPPTLLPQVYLSPCSKPSQSKLIRSSGFNNAHHKDLRTCICKLFRNGVFADIMKLTILRWSHSGFMLDLTIQGHMFLQEEEGTETRKERMALRRRQRLVWCHHSKAMPGATKRWKKQGRILPEKFHREHGSANSLMTWFWLLELWESV